VRERYNGLIAGWLQHQAMHVYEASMTHTARGEGRLATCPSCCTLREERVPVWLCLLASCRNMPVCEESQAHCLALAMARHLRRLSQWLRIEGCTVRPIQRHCQAPQMILH
jgi:hypothetical protein